MLKKPLMRVLLRYPVAYARAQIRLQRSSGEEKGKPVLTVE
jgi:hypothetical protein